ncbi:glycosyltransferase family 2 protein [Microbacterium sp. E-13]|uniref:glycosyltransferase family 2 protein n=1 Tax=Microbacterium sp. E-13 TaxID=3404048 RepID=UPI003CFA365C
MDPRSVSVIIPTNRDGRYLRETVASVRAQTAAVGEIVLVDDGAPAPGLAAIAAELGVSYVRQDAAGLSVARNTGVEAARGEWIAFLDDDDVWHPDRIRSQLDALAAAPAAIAAYTGGWYMDAEGTPFGTGWPAPAASAHDMLAGAVTFPRITTLLIQRRAYLAVGGCRSDMEPAEDNELILRLLQHGEFAAVDRQLVGYRRHSANVTNRGLPGREAAMRGLRGHVRGARRRGDRRLAHLLTQNLRRYRRFAADENLAELAAAAKSRDRGYLVALSWWAIRSAPLDSAGAVARRMLRHG